jgi:hypothetical protein
MTFNSDLIIKDIRTDFEELLDFVMGEEARTASADRIERGLFKMLLSLGAKLLTLFFAMRSQACARDCLVLADGGQLAYHRDTKRDYFSIFGKLAFWRPYFYQKGLSGQAPLDAELSLGEDCYSDLVREVSEYLAVYGVYHKTSDILERLLGLPLSTRVVAMNLAEDAADVEAYYAQKAPPAPATEAEILVIQADGKGVPMILAETARDKVRLGKGEKRGRKKEAVVTGVYTIVPVVRTPEQIVSSFFDQTDGAGERRKPQNKHLWATLDGKDTALARLGRQVAPRQGSHIQDKVALCDGCAALQSRIAQQFPDFTQVLDFIHANEYLWKVANSLLGENNDQRTKWVKSHTLQMLSGQTDQLIAEFHHLAQQPQIRAAQRTQLQKTANYFERNLLFMDYPSYLSKGWPIASGVIEGACRHFVKDRCELSGMRWLQTGAENLLRLRAVAENGDWDDYHAYRKQQRHRRLYGTLPSAPEAIEIQALNLPAVSQEPVSSNNHTSYDQLPLAA